MEKSAQELQNDVKKYTRRKFISLAVAGIGLTTCINTIVSGHDIKEPKINKDYENASQTLNWFGGGEYEFTDPQYPEIEREPEIYSSKAYETPEVQEYFKGLSEYNARRNKAKKSLEIEVSKIKKDPEFLEYKKKLRKIDGKDIKKIIREYMVMFAGVLGISNYEDKLKKAKNKLKIKYSIN